MRPHEWTRLVEERGESDMKRNFATMLGRRQFLMATAGLVGVGLLAACGADDDDSEGSTADPTATTPPAADPAPTEVEDAPEDEDEEEADGTEEPDDDTGDGEAKSGGTLLIGQDFGPQDMDPTISGAWASTNIQELIFTGLLRWSSEMELEPDLATDWEISDDGLTYTFNLREGVTFHNGKAFTSEDVKFTFERILDPETASPRISVYRDVESIETPDDMTTQFNLASPIAPLLRNMATIPNGAIVPSNATDDELNDDAPGTGPFRFVEHVLDQEVRLEKFDDYYEEGLPYLDAVTFRLLADDTSISAALRSESVHIAWLKDPKVAQNISQTTENLQSVEGTSSRYLPILFDLKEPPFDDVNVRRAMSLAVDRSVLVEAVLGGFGSVGTFLPPSQLAGYVDDGSGLPYYERDVEEAKRLLQEAGYEQLDVPEFKVVAANSLDVQCAQVMAEQWAEANINVTINPMEVGAILDDFRSGNFKMAVVGGVWTPDPSNEVARYHSESPQGSAYGINDPEVDELIEQGLAESDPDTRVEIYTELQEHILDQVYVIVPYTYPLRWELLWNYVQGYDVMASNARISVRKTWLDV
jgi:peptide/nickel transport system substrate-binding protein